MTPLRGWTAAAVLLALAAGVMAGLAIAGASGDAAADPLLPEADREYMQRFSADFALSADQQALLMAVLRRRARDEAQILRANLAKFPVEVQEQIRLARRTADKRIEILLDPEQRARYEQKRNDSQVPALGAGR